MQATKSAKAKLRLHGTSSPGQCGSEKTTRHSGDKTGSKHGVESMGHGYSSSWSSWCMLGYSLSTFEALDIFRIYELDSLDKKESEFPSQSL
ncbi:hypothetical protein Bca4012_074818 [Brassica carinata]